MIFFNKQGCLLRMWSFTSSSMCGDFFNFPLQKHTSSWICYNKLSLGGNGSMNVCKLFQFRVNSPVLSPCWLLILCEPGGMNKTVSEDE